MNRSEFLNWHLKAYLSNRQDKAAVQFARSCPYYKNDNAHKPGMLPNCPNLEMIAKSKPIQ
jgi:hypothetical protein